MLEELDTTTDFIRYLTAKENLVIAASSQVVMKSERDLLAVYLHRGRLFPATDALFAQPGAWDEFTAKKEWRERKEADRESYTWDRLIEAIAENPGVPDAIGAMDLDRRELVLRQMAREDRFARRILARSFNEFMADASAYRTRARTTVSPSGVVYVFLALPRDHPRADRILELHLRSFVARGLAEQPTIRDMARLNGHPVHQNGVVIGLATERYVGLPGYSFDVVRLEIPEWTNVHEARMSGIQQELGFFAKPKLRGASVDEYPKAYE